MSILTSIFVVLTALEFFFIFYLETFATASEKTAQTFGMTVDELKRDSVNTLFKNQGVYNGLIGVLLLINLFPLHSKISVLLILGFIIIVAAYGSLTSNPKIILNQGGIAMVAFVLVLIFGL
jgi:putative membrane protein